MVDINKTRLMTKLAIYEKHEGQDDIAMAKYYKADYVHIHILKTILAVTFGYACMLAMLAIYYSEFILDNALILNYKLLGEKILGFYLFFLIIYIALSLIGYNLRYTKSRKRLSKYYKTLGKIRTMEEEQERLRDMEEDQEDYEA